MPAEYTLFGPPKPWTPADVVAVSSLIGGIFGDGGGGEVAQRGPAPVPAGASSASPRERPPSPTSRSRTTRPPRRPWSARPFPYEIPKHVNPATIAIPDNPSAPLKGGPADTTPGCSATAPSKAGLSVIESLLRFPAQMSNALVVGARPLGRRAPDSGLRPAGVLLRPAASSCRRTSTRRATTPRVRRSPAPASSSWAAARTTRGRPRPPGSDLTDQRLELICNPNGGKVPPTGTFYMFHGKCIPMTNEQFPDGTVGGVLLNHKIHLTVHGVVQGWTTALGGKPVAVVNQRSTYNHDVDSVIGFMRFGEPALTYSAKSWMVGASKIDYTFNWFYVDNRNIAYYVSGLDPVRPSFVDPNLPTWGTGGRRVARVPARLQARARDRPAAGLLRQLEQQAGPALLGLRRRVRVRAGVPGADAHRPDPAPVRHPSREDHPGEPGPGDGDRGEPGPGRADDPARAAARDPAGGTSPPGSARC